MTSMKRATYPTVVRGTGDEANILISTVSEDRDGDVLEPEGLIQEPYARNPVVLFGHRHDQLPVGATTALDVEPGRGVRATFRWLNGDEFADRVRNAFEQGVLRAASVSFIPRESAPLSGGRGFRFKKWELIEWSLVCVPSNPAAVRTLKGLGLWDDESVVLEIEDEPTYSHEAIASAYEALGRQARGWTKTEPFEQLAFDGDERELLALIRMAVRDTLTESIREAAMKAVGRMRGRVD